MAKQSNKAAKAEVIDAKAALAPKLVTLRNAVRVEVAASDALFDALKDCGGPTVVEAKEAVLAERMAVALESAWGVTGEEAYGRAVAVLKKPGATSKAADRRTAAEETAYGAARTYWSRLAGRFNIARVDTRGGDTSKTRKPKAPKAQAEPDTKLVKAGSPEAPGQDAKPVTKEAAREFIRAQSAMLDAFAKKHAALLPLALKEAVADFYRRATSSEVELPEAAPAPVAAEPERPSMAEEIAKVTRPRRKRAA